MKASGDCPGIGRSIQPPARHEWAPSRTEPSRTNPSRTKRSGGWLLPAVSVVLISAGCDALRGERVSCADSIETLRQAVSYADFENARAWREYAWSVCDDKSTLKTLDDEIIAAEKKDLAARAEAGPEAQAAAQTRINAAQTLWLAFDRLTAKQRTEDRLAKTLASADQLAEGLTPGYGAKLREYNAAQHQSRVAKTSKAK